MKSILKLVVIILFVLPACINAQDNQIQQTQIDVVYLSSDLLEGRGTGSKGEKIARTYLAKRFGDIGLTPKGSNGTWFHDYSFKEKTNPHEAIGTGREVHTKNVVGYIDNKAENTIIIGAHYDHLGFGGHGSLSVDSAIHNGADDNASGVAALLNLAKRLKNSKTTNHNNYLFIAFSGEELGLFGSKSYVNNPTIDLSKVDYMINMDMVGRLNEESKLAVYGTGTSPVWHEILDKIKVDGIGGIVTHDSGIGPSDHTSFYLADMPVLHFFTGQHSDYHKPGDDAELINYEGILAVTDYISEVIKAVDGKGKLEFTKTKEEEQKKAARFKVSLGVMPDYMYDGEGMRIDGVMDGKVADKAGFKKGDIVIQIADVVVTDIYKYMEGLSKCKAGEKAMVKVKRGDEVIEQEVTF